MARTSALWIPFWYGLDQSLEVGVRSDLDFFHEPPPALAAGGLRVLYHGDWNARSRFYSARCHIHALEHSVLGPLHAINVRELDYDVTLRDGRTISVDAEQQPGTAAGLPTPIPDWRVLVDLEAV